MAEFTLNDLARLLRGGDGTTELASVDSTVANTPFAELGLDSLALLELSSRIGRENGVRIPDDAVRRMTTPDEAVRYVNELLDGPTTASRPKTPSGVGHTDNEIIIAAPMDLVWTMTNDVSGWPQLFSEYASTEVLGQDGETIRFRLTMHPDEQGNAWSWVSERTPDPASHTVRSRRVEPGWFEHMDIYWEYRQADDGVAMRWVQDFRMRADSPVDDAAMTRRINENTVVQMVRIKQIVERVAAVRAAEPVTAAVPADDALTGTETGG